MAEKHTNNHTEWKKYDNEREYKTTAELLVIRPIESDFTPIFCPCCKFAMQTTDDFFSYKDKKACYKCTIYLEKLKTSTFDGSLGFKIDNDYLTFRRKTFKPVIRFK